MVKVASLIRFGPSYFSAMLCVSVSTELSKVNERFSNPYKPGVIGRNLTAIQKSLCSKKLTAFFEGLNLYPGHANERPKVINYSVTASNGTKLKKRKLTPGYRTYFDTNH